MPELCVACGHCVETCPVGAKRVRNDLDRIRGLLLEKKQVIVSLAPSFIAEFDDIGAARLPGHCTSSGSTAYRKQPSGRRRYRPMPRR